jgi:protein SCO1
LRAARHCNRSRPGSLARTPSRDCLLPKGEGRVCAVNGSSTIYRRFGRRLAAVLLVVALAACSAKPQFELNDVTGAAFGRDFQLVDQNGQKRALTDFRGKVVAVFFGYTYCPDVCPTTLGEYAMVAKELGAEASRLQVLFVTVDPERDTPAVLGKYVPAFNPSFLGLTGDPKTIESTAKEFKIFYQKQPLPDGSYTVDHTAGSYIYDPAGRLRLFASYGAGAPKLLHDIRSLLKGN